MATDRSLGEVKEAQVGRERIRYRERGGGPPVVFVHGLLSNGDLWRKVVPRLDGVRCISPDWPLGSHELPLSAQADTTPSGIADLVGDFLDSLDLAEVTLVGNDTGGALCQLLVTSRPERVARLVLTNCDAYERFPPPLFAYLGLVARSRLTVYLLAQSLRAPKLERLPIAQGWLAKRPIERAIVDSFLGPVRKSGAIRRDLRAVLRHTDAGELIAAARRLRAFDRPVLLAWASEDRVFPAVYAHRLANDFPSARLELIPDSYTYVPEDQPERLAELIAEFVA
jgi:pimeloyl-ACP methyl ester carboxylesterase